jgi:hypothetical protein
MSRAILAEDTRVMEVHGATHTLELISKQKH